MSFNYLRYWENTENEKDNQKTKAFKESTKNEVIHKPLLTNTLLIIEGKNTATNNHRQRPKDLNAFFLKRERETLKAIRQ